jgi:hypothetical protein
MAAVHGYGHYTETYEKIDGSWHTKTLIFTMLRLDSAQHDELPGEST